MASCISPIVVDLSSDSEHGNDCNLQTSSSQPRDCIDVDWADYDYLTSIDDILDTYSKQVKNDDHEKASISSAETEIYTPNIVEQMTSDESPAKQNSSRILSRKGRAAPKQVEKLLKEQNKLEKKRLKNEKKAEELKQKRLRAVLAQKQKNLKPEENIKLICINVDTQVINSEFGAVVISSLQQAGINYDVANQIKPSTISWSKKVRDIIVSDEGVIQEDVGTKEEKELFYIINSNEMVKLVHSNELLTCIQTIKSVYYDKCVTLVVIGMEKYFHLKKKKLSQGSSEQNGKKRGFQNSYGSDYLHVSRDEIQTALIELQIIGNCNHCMIETGEELASLILSTTKSLSQLDYKKERNQREEGYLDWFAKGDSKQCVKVDKNGIGLEKLWQQQICQFNAVGLEMANAITSEFLSPRNLIESYKNCGSKSEGELLLQNILIRRDAGILSSTRRIGPELSKKLYNFYMSDDPNLQL